MSGLRKRMRRKLLTEAARQQRQQTAGQGQYRRPLRSWVESTKVDLVRAYLHHASQTAADASDPTPMTEG